MDDPELCEKRMEGKGEGRKGNQVQRPRGQKVKKGRTSGERASWRVGGKRVGPCDG